jgi:hypothetical protein
MEESVKNKYNVAGGNVGAFGDNAKAENFVQQNLTQVTQTVDLVKLVNELSQLASIAHEKAVEPEHQIDISAINAAKVSAEKGDESKTLQCLRSVSKWGLEMATQVGATLVAEIIKKHMGIS